MLAVALLALAASGCGDDEGEDTPATKTTKESGGSGSGADATKEDDTAKSNAHAAQSTIETYASDNGGSYKGATPENLTEIEPVTSDVGVKTTADTYSITASSQSGNTFTIERDASGKVTRTCTKAGEGGCDSSGEW